MLRSSIAVITLTSSQKISAAAGGEIINVAIVFADGGGTLGGLFESKHAVRA
jgi:hypothetical protein